MEKKGQNGKKQFLVSYSAKYKMISGMLNLEDLYFL